MSRRKAAEKVEEKPRQTFVVKVSEACEDQARIEKLEEIAEIDNELNRVGAEKSAANAGFNGQLKGLRKAQEDALRCLSSGVMSVEREVYTKVNEERMEVVTYRVDNDEPIPELTRAMTPAERQMSLEDCFNLPPGGLEETEGDDEAEDGGEAA
jgi:hypothetical protein